MRRKDRAVTSQQEIQEIVEDCHVLHLGLIDEAYPYVVPVNFGYEWQGEQLILYIHGATVGKKIDCVQKNPHVCVEMDGNHQLISGGRVAAKYSFAYHSFIGFGEAEVLTDIQEKKYGLTLLMHHEIGDTPYDEIPDSVIKKTGVIKITVNEYSGKAHRMN